MFVPLIKRCVSVTRNKNFWLQHEFNGLISASENKKHYLCMLFTDRSKENCAHTITKEHIHFFLEVYEGIFGLWYNINSQIILRSGWVYHRLLCKNQTANLWSDNLCKMLCLYVRLQCVAVSFYRFTNLSTNEVCN